MSKQYIIQKQTLENIADTIRAKTGLTGDIKISDITPDNEEIMSNTSLPKLTNPASPYHILTDYEVIDENGNVVVGEMISGPGMEHEIGISEDGVVISKVVFIEEGFVASGVHRKEAQLNTQPAKTITPGATEQIAVEAGKYTTGDIIIEGDSNLKAENIKSGVSIFGVAGTATAGGGSGGVIESVTCTLVEDGPCMDYMGQFYYLNDSGICTKKEVMTVGQNLMVMKNSIIVIAGSTVSGGVTYLIGDIRFSAYRVDGDFYIKANM